MSLGHLLVFPVSFSRFDRYLRDLRLPKHCRTSDHLDFNLDCLLGGAKYSGPTSEIFLFRYRLCLPFCAYGPEILQKSSMSSVTPAVVPRVREHNLRRWVCINYSAAKRYDRTSERCVGKFLIGCSSMGQMILIAFLCFSRRLYFLFSECRNGHLLPLCALSLPMGDAPRRMPVVEICPWSATIGVNALV